MLNMLTVDDKLSSCVVYSVYVFSRLATILHSRKGGALLGGEEALCPCTEAGATQ